MEIDDYYPAYNQATLTPDRNDRPQFMQFCDFQLNRMRTVDTMCIKMCDPPTTKGFDLVTRVKQGIEIAKRRGIDRIVMVESDDYYQGDYLSKINLIDYDFYGWSTTYYYNVRTRQYQRNYHDGHSSLFCTAFKMSALEGFVWPPDDYVWLDIAIWKHARGRRMFLNDGEPPCIGIKHNIGKVAGKAHKFELKHPDPDFKWLKDHTDEEAYNFYTTIKW